MITTPVLQEEESAKHALQQHFERNMLELGFSESALEVSYTGYTYTNEVVDCMWRVYVKNAQEGV